MTNSIELSGATLDKFKEYLDNHINVFMSDANGYLNNYPTFKRLNLDYQIGCYITFFGTLGINIFIQPSVYDFVDDELLFTYRVMTDPLKSAPKIVVNPPNYSTRDEARQGAIHTVNQLYNLNHNTNKNE